jgi:hypothetical protein
MIQGWGKKIVIVLNKTDVFDQPSELTRVVGFVRDAGESAGRRPRRVPGQRASRNAPSTANRAVAPAVSTARTVHPHTLDDEGGSG